MRKLTLALLPAFAAPALAQYSLPAPTLELRTAPRAAWSAVNSAGNNTTGSTFRCDNPGAASNDKIYVFGGCLNNNTTTTVNDLWVFDALAGTFTQAHDGVQSLAPHARGRACVAWNPNSGKLVVFGGDNRATGPLPADTLMNDTWEYDPVTNTWANVTPASGSPAPRRWAAMNYDPATGGMLLFGGDLGGNVVSNETWLFLGGTWAQMSPAHVPPARRLASAVTRPDFGDVVLLSGEDNSGTGPYGADLYRHLDVWAWSGTDWYLLSEYNWVTGTGTFPASANSGQPVYDQLRQRIVLQGGNGIAAGTTANATYLFGTSLYNGSPSDFTSEFDCLTNSWTLYATSPTATAAYNINDPVIGRISRFFAGYVPATGKVYKLCGQNPALSGSKPALNCYEYQASPVATAAPIGSGCTGSAGPLALNAGSLPWSGRSVLMTGTGFPAGSIGFAVIGLGTQNLPISSVHPAGVAGCNLLVTNDAVLFVIPAAGQIQYSINLPPTTAYAGLTINTQGVCIALSPTLAITSTNGVGLTIGAM